MSPEEVRGHLIAILDQVQATSDGTPVPITGATCPLSDVPGVDTKVLPAAITMLAEATGLTIPNNKNVFLSPSGQPLTVDQIATRVCSVATRGTTVA
jgi:hypothetical protein